MLGRGHVKVRVGSERTNVTHRMNKLLLSYSYITRYLMTGNDADSDVTQHIRMTKGGKFLGLLMTQK